MRKLFLRGERMFLKKLFSLLLAGFSVACAGASLAERCQNLGRQLLPSFSLRDEEEDEEKALASFWPIFRRRWKCDMVGRVACDWRPEILLATLSELLATAIFV